MAASAEEFNINTPLLIHSKLDGSKLSVQKKRAKPNLKFKKVKSREDLVQLQNIFSLFCLGRK